MAVPVRVAEARRQPLEERVSLVATVAANEAVEVQSEVDGMIEEIGFTEGQRVRKGQALFRLDARKLAASVAQAEANFRLAEANHRRAQSLLEDKTISQQEFDQIAAAYDAQRATLELMRRQRDDTVLIASFDGVMSARRVSAGQVIAKGAVLGTLVDLDEVKAEFRAPERFLSQIAVGQKVSLRVEAFPQETFGGEVYFVDPRVEETTRTVLMKAALPNPDLKLRPGMFGNLDLILRVKEEAVVVPETALLTQSGRVHLFVVDAEEAAQLRPVEVGLRRAGQAEILRGVAAGERVVVEGHQKLAPGLKVQIAGEP